MPSSEGTQSADRDEDEEDEESETVSPAGSAYRSYGANRLRDSRPGSVNSRLSNRSSSPLKSRPNSGTNQQPPVSVRQPSTVGVPGSRAVSRQAGNHLMTNVQKSNVVREK